MMPTMGNGSPDPFRPLAVGDVLGTAAQVIGANVGALVLIALTCLSPALLPGFLFRLARTAGMLGDASAITPDTFVPFLATAGAGTVVLGLLTLVFSAVSQGAMLFMTIETMAGRRATVGSSLRVAISRLLPLLGVSLLSALVVWLGLLLCLVPGIYLAIIFYVCVPVTVTEGLNPVEALRRSTALTLGHRWNLLAIAIVVGLISTALALANYAVGSGLRFVTASVASSWVREGVVFGIEAITQVLQAVVDAVVVGVAYTRLRGINDGVDVDAIARVFE